MEIKVYGQIVKERYVIDWDWENTDYEDILNNTEKYIKVDSHAIGYKDVPQSLIGKDGVYRIFKTEFDIGKGLIIHYCDFVIETIEADEEERLEKIEYAKKQCKGVLELRQQSKECKKKWYQFFK